ncbi:MAG: hypothetical protein RLZZ312_78 [Bacteroidota bacterium]
MLDNIKKFLNEEQDSKAIAKIAAKLNDLLMKNEEVGYIAVQKKPVTLLPDSIILTNKRIIICRSKNLGLSMEFLDYNWDDVTGTFIKENILGSEFSFSTKSDFTISIDYIPKAQARKISTYAKQQLDNLKNDFRNNSNSAEIKLDQEIFNEKAKEIFETEEVKSYAEIMPIENNFKHEFSANIETEISNSLSQDELFSKLQNYKKLLDNGLILQGEYDVYKKEILSLM